jgi:aspartyl aminopeptidase
MDTPMANTSISDGLIAFLAESPTPFHAVDAMRQRLEAAGFSALREKDVWQLEKGGRYFVVRNESSIVAFINGAQSPVEAGVRIVGAHTDSPCLKVKPQPEMHERDYFQLGVEVYGGVLLPTWFDRDLSLAGRVTYRKTDGTLSSKLVNFKRPIATVASLAIHLDRTQNDGRKINKQTDIAPLLGQVVGEETKDFRDILATQLRSEHPDCQVDAILDYEMSFYDTQPAAVVGLEGDFLVGARLDNLLSCYIGLEALLQSDGSQSAVLICTDHEEVGSRSTAGANGPLLEQVLQRWVGSYDNYCRLAQHSMLVSADNAHGIHPNFQSVHEPNHWPLLNKGPVIKINANQRYASNSVTQAIFRHACHISDVPVQSFVTRTDLGCGSTIGPVTATETGIRTVDIGLPTFGMHSIRETAGTRDAELLVRALVTFFALNDVSSVE